MSTRPGFRPSKSIAEQTFTFVHSGHSFSVKADHRTALYDMIAEDVDYDCYQLNKLDWESGRGSLHRGHRGSVK